jgi:hypothetical protein
MNNKTLKGSRELYDLRDEAAAGLFSMVDMYIDSTKVFLNQVKIKGIKQSINSYSAQALYGDTMFFYATQTLKSICSVPPTQTAPHLSWIRGIEYALTDALGFVMYNTRGAWRECSRFSDACQMVKAQACKDFQSEFYTPCLREIATKARGIYNSIATSTCPACDGSGIDEIQKALGIEKPTCFRCMGEGTSPDHDLMYQYNGYKFDYTKIINQYEGRVVNA